MYQLQILLNPESQGEWYTYFLPHTFISHKPLNICIAYGGLDAILNFENSENMYVICIATLRSQFVNRKD